jgi:hypothetical protein
MRLRVASLPYRTRKLHKGAIAGLDAQEQRRRAELPI